MSGDKAALSLSDWRAPMFDQWNSMDIMADDRASLC